METCPIDHAAPVSLSMETSSYKIEVQALQIDIFPPIDALSDFEDASCWDDLTDALKLLSVIHIFTSQILTPFQ